MSHTNKASAGICANVLIKHGINEIIVSPGSRCAPLVEAFASIPETRITMIIDERCAAFYALGLAQGGKKTALVCTSGTAVLNYAPAIAEAYYQGLPIIAISADRPMQWIDQDDSQTIRQYEGISHFVKKSFDIPDFADTDQEMRWYAMRTLNQAVEVAFESKKGPVHVNMQFNAPLTSKDDNDHTSDVRIVEAMFPGVEISRKDCDALLARMHGKKVLLVAGYMLPDHKLSHAVKRFCDAGNVALLAEKLSNLKTIWPMGIDRVLRFADASIEPDIVITIGGALVSRHVKEWLRNLKNVEHWTIGYDSSYADCFKHLTLRIRTDAATMLGKLATLMHKTNAEGMETEAMHYHNAWRKLWLKASSSICELDAIPFSDLGALAWIYSNGVPEQYNIQLSNGTSVRYGELLINDHQHAIYCNRGTSGIEGCTATAIGASVAYSGPTLLVTGDMCFLHDLGALTLDTPDRLKILVVNNDGGDIFRFIGTTSHLPHRELRYCCSQCMHPEVQNIASAFGFTYFKASDYDELKHEWYQFLNHKGKAIFELDTRNRRNSEILTDYFKTRHI